MNLPRIFLFTDWYLPGYKAGGPIQACRNIVETLKDRYSFFIFTSDRDLGDPAPYERIQTDRWISESASVSIWYASPGLVKYQNLAALFQQINPEFVYFNSMFSFRYTLLPLRFLRSSGFRGKIILAPRGMLHQGALRNKSFKKSIFLKLFRLLGWHKKLIFQATDEQELKDILFFFGERTRVFQVSDIPNLYRGERLSPIKKRGELKCIFISRIEPKKNLHYFLDRLVEISGSYRIILDIFGGEEDPDYLSHCKTRIASLGPEIQVHFRGPLPNHQVYETLNQYHFFVLPTLGENFGFAIMEALSTGRPVIISDQTPWRGLEKRKAGWDIPLSRPDQFRQAIELAAGFDQPEYDEWSLQAWDFAHQYEKNLNSKEDYIKLFQ
jgi:glycosyltransferase involved in cell wall biosynthesis